MTDYRKRYYNEERRDKYRYNCQRRRVANIYTFYGMELVWHSLNNCNNSFARDEEISRFEVEFELFVDNLQKHLLDVVYYSCLCEARHTWSQSTWDHVNTFSARDILLIRKIKNMDRRVAAMTIRQHFKYNKVDAMDFALRCFSCEWDEDFGGYAWLNGVKAWFKLLEAKTLSDKCMWIDRVFDLQHNSGVLFNKHYHYENGDNPIIEALDTKREARNIYDLLYTWGYKNPKEYRASRRYKKLFTRYEKYCNLPK